MCFLHSVMMLQCLCEDCNSTVIQKVVSGPLAQFWSLIQHSTLSKVPPKIWPKFQTIIFYRRDGGQSSAFMLLVSNAVFTAVHSKITLVFSPLLRWSIVDVQILGYFWAYYIAIWCLQTLQARQVKKKRRKKIWPMMQKLRKTSSESSMPLSLSLCSCLFLSGLHYRWRTGAHFKF